MGNCCRIFSRGRDMEKRIITVFSWRIRLFPWGSLCYTSRVLMQQKTVQVLSIALFAALLTWGLYTVLMYMGVPVHISVLLSGEGQNWVTSLCSAEGSQICRGFFATPAMIVHTLGRAA